MFFQSLKTGDLVVCVDDKDYHPDAYPYLRFFPKRGFLYKIREIIVKQNEIKGVKLEGVYNDVNPAFATEVYYSIKRFSAFHQFIPDVLTSKSYLELRDLIFEDIKN